VGERIDKLGNTRATTIAATLEINRPSERILLLSFGWFDEQIDEKSSS
jgi:hypothetical protein